MKALKLTIVALCGLVFSVSAQQKVSDKAVIKTPTIGSEYCQQTVELYLRREYGISSVKVDLKKKTTTVTWLTDRTNIETIRAAIANLGFDADDIEAEEYAYKRVPKECKRHDSVTVQTPPVQKKN
jgi:mercuric ion binding protein